MAKMGALQQAQDTIGLTENILTSKEVKRVRAIQLEQGKEVCFATDKRYECAEMCEWRQNCRKLKAAWLRH